MVDQNGDPDVIVTVGHPDSSLYCLDAGVAGKHSTSGAQQLKAGGIRCRRFEHGPGRRTDNHLRKQINNATFCREHSVILKRNN